MLQKLREYWLPWMLFAATLLVAATLVLLVASAPFLVEHVSMLALFAADATVRRTSIAGAIGLIVTAFVFFRPSTSVLSRKPAKKPPGDTIAGA